MPRKSVSDWDTIRRWASLILAIAGLAGISTLIVAIWLNRFDPVLTDIALKNFPVIIGLPLAAIVAFVVVVFFKQAEAPMVVKFPGVELSGSSGEVFLWLVTFVTISSMIHWLWAN